LSKLLSISFWQCKLSWASLITFGGLNLFYIYVIAYSPFSKQGIVIPPEVYIIFTKINILF
jgi:hypothetical protein